MGKRIFVGEVSHENAPLHVREKLAFGENEIIELIEKLNLKLDEVFVLSTCNRFAIYGVGDNFSPVHDFFSSWVEVAPYVQYYTSSEQSVKHLFATASGLCSQVKGEHQITGQVKESYHQGAECNSIGLVLDNLLREAIRIGKKVRTETGIDKFSTSVVDAGFSILDAEVSDLSSMSFLVVGTGKIARLSLDWMRRMGISNVKVASHKSERSQMAAEKYGYEAVGMQEVAHSIDDFDIIIGGTHSEVDLLSHSNLCCKNSIRFSTLKKRLILDFGVPRNFNENIRSFPGVQLYDLDDLKAKVSSPLEGLGSLETAWEIVHEETNRFLTHLKQLQVSPILSAYWTRLVNIKEKELNWLFPKLNNITEREQELIRRCAHRLIRGIAKDPLSNIREMASNGMSGDATQAVMRLYNINSSNN